MKALAHVALLLLIVVVDVAARKEVDWDALEKAWEADDAPHERRSSADDQYDQLQAMPQAQATAMGPQMVFVTLTTREPLSELAGRWKEMLWNGGVDVNIYEIEASKVLVGLQKGMFVRELRRFLHAQPEVVTYDWNSQTFTPADPIVDDTPLRKKTKKVKTKKKKKTKATAPVRDHPKSHDGL